MIRNLFKLTKHKFNKILLNKINNYLTNMRILIKFMTFFTHMFVVNSPCEGCTIPEMSTIIYFYT